MLVQVPCLVCAGSPVAFWGSTGVAPSAWAGTRWRRGGAGLHAGSHAAWSPAAAPCGVSVDAACSSAAPRRTAAPSPLCPNLMRNHLASYSCYPRFAPTRHPEKLKRFYVEIPLLSTRAHHSSVLLTTLSS